MKITLALVRQLCPACADEMEKRRWTELEMSALPAEIKAQFNEGMCERFGSGEGFFSRCVSTMSGQEGVDDPNSFCAALHNECIGKYPGEGRAEASGDFDFRVSTQVMASGAGNVFEVVLARAGETKNDFDFSEPALEAAARLFEGKPVYSYFFQGANGAPYLDHMPKDVRKEMVARAGAGTGLLKNFVGQVSGVRFGEYVDRTGKKQKGLLAKFHSYRDWVAEVLTACVKHGRDLVGFSMDGAGLFKVLANGRRLIEQITDVKEMTVVSEPAAGGEVLAIVASVAQKGQSNGKNKDQSDNMEETARRVFAEHQAAATVLQVSREAGRAAVKSSNLPAPVQTAILASLGDEIDPQRAALEIQKTNAILAAGERRSPLFVPGQERNFGQTGNQQAGNGQNQVVITLSEYDRMVCSFTNMLTGKREHNIEPYKTPQHAYRTINGMWTQTKPEIGRAMFNEIAASLKPILTKEDDWRSYWLQMADAHRQQKHSGMITSSVTSTTFGAISNDSINKALLQYYNVPDLMQQINMVVSNYANVDDFKQQERYNVGGYPLLPIVAEAGTYQPLTSPSEERTFYSLQKRGGTEDYSIEAATNDNLGLLARIPQLLGQSAIRTKHHFVLGLFLSNPAFDSDSQNIASAAHSNLGTTALSWAALRAGIFQMYAQKELSSGESLNLQAATLWVGVLLWDIAWELVAGSEFSVSGGRTETVRNFFKEVFNVEVAVVNYPALIDANDWWLTGPTSYPMIEVGYLGGQSTPQIYVADAPTVGQRFTADIVAIKIYFPFGGKVVNFRGFQGNIVT